jgi:hypothetical protein
MTPTPTETPLPTLRPTDTLTPTPKTPEFYHGLALDLNLYTELQSKADLVTLVAYLHSQPSLLTDGSKAWIIGVGQNNSLTISCAMKGDVNCAVAASVKVMDEGYWRWINILEIRNRDGSRGYLLGYFFDGIEQSGLEDYIQLCQDPSVEDFSIYRSLSALEQTKYPYAMYLLQQPGNADLLEKFRTTGNIPSELEDQIINFAL